MKKKQEEKAKLDLKHLSEYAISGTEKEWSEVVASKDGIVSVKR